MKAGKYYIETYGCQMNEADSEIIAGLLERENFISTCNPDEADIILVNTCSVRHGADNRAISRLSQFKSFKKTNPNLLLGLVGCVAQRDRGKILEEKPFIDLVLGPDAYRQIPELVVNKTHSFIDVNLSRKEVYDGLMPFRNSIVNAWVSIMRGCDKFCSYCIVPYTRGRERSRSIKSIVEEIKRAVSDGYQEITLLGQNVNSYRYDDHRFPDLLIQVAEIPGVKRVRFTSPHPEDVNTRMLEAMRDYDNICKHIHLPLQSGSTKVLSAMNRSYTQEKYLDFVTNIRKYLPECGITTDIIVGFPGETAADFEETLHVMDEVIFDNAYMFKYSPRPNTAAAKLTDDVTEEEKAERLNLIIAKQKRHTTFRNRQTIGTIQSVLIDGCSKKNVDEKIGRTDSNKLVILKEGSADIGDLINILITGAPGVSLFGKIQKS
ncbi:tRNA (N6-isopentenyl adenosine(37)-C2)-methylthiotransferase MiaB [bacterium]|nr:tRNA (N6-isopentenyl adenosine(37)-C2)-methylthiotransferase MiaB [bacterium]MBU1065491.1 tRNA (N6-isopentenyl adenosine(37)-C2)-methylthiotransferase MiaB [bacterium]MBU1634830.1 tRNA (N6-isopentenyl adenosine(37)-C2)-methylthiotransferase MiaB [bacterium]MBU1873134.1 tRNA (N6-isopentenyl adenosine(37)-C2)-methylthiotransferase MiaB [bacterium]